MLLSNGDDDDVDLAIRCESISYISNWLELEFPDSHNDKETRGVWNDLDDLDARQMRGGKKKRKALVKKTGIRRRPLLSRLPIDFLESISYDPMHVCLLGWVRHILSL